MGHARTQTEAAVDRFTSNVESLLIALSQRSMTVEQRDRLAAVLQRGERDLLRRCTTSRVKDPTPVRVASSTRSRSRAA